MEFCQIQINYLDWSFQDAKAKVELLKEYNLPVWVMEPLRGGKLAKLKDREEEILKSMRPDEGIPAWAFRFLQSIPEVTMTLSGMSNMEQLQDNISTFETEKPLSNEEMDKLLVVCGKRNAGRHTSVYRMPLLCQPLSTGTGYPEPVESLQ